MAEEIKSIFKSRNYWMAFAISFLTLLGYSLSSWLNAISVGESMEYRESALSLSVGGIFFGGFMLLFPFCASVAHATSQVDELRSGMARWRVMRGSVARYVGVKAAASMLAAAQTDEGRGLENPTPFFSALMRVPPRSFFNQFARR